MHSAIILLTAKFCGFLGLMLCTHDWTFNGLNHVRLFDGLATDFSMDFRQIGLVYTQSHQSPTDSTVMTYDQTRIRKFIASSQ